MNISENLQLLLNTKESIRQAINEKYGDTLVESGTPFSAYSAAILELCQEPTDPCDGDPCYSSECPGYDECSCEGTGCECDPCDTEGECYDECECDPCSNSNCDRYYKCECEGIGCEECPEEIPLGRYQFTLEQGAGILVEAVGTEPYYQNIVACTSPDDFSWSRTIYVYDSPTGSTPINTIQAGLYRSDGRPEDGGGNTNYNAGVIVWGSGWPVVEGIQTGETSCDGVQAMLLHCETAGTYYFEESGYTSVRFFSDEYGTELEPECIEAYDWNLYVEDFGLDDGGVQFYDNDPHELKVLFGETPEFGPFTSAGTVPYGEYTIGLYDYFQLTGSPTPEDCSMSENGATLTDDGSAWYWTAVSMMRWDYSSIAVFDADGNLKLTTHIDYGPI